MSYIDKMNFMHIMHYMIRSRHDDMQVPSSMYLGGQPPLPELLVVTVEA